MPAVRRAATWLHLILAVAIIVGVFLQVYLIASHFFGASGALDAHKSVGGVVHGLEGLLFLAALVAWLPRADIGLSLLLLVVGTVQIALVDASKWVGGLHGLLALFVLVIAT